MASSESASTGTGHSVRGARLAVLGAGPIRFVDGGGGPGSSGPRRKWRNSATDCTLVSWTAGTRVKGRRMPPTYGEI